MFNSYNYSLKQKTVNQLKRRRTSNVSKVRETFQNAVWQKEVVESIYKNFPELFRQFHVKELRAMIDTLGITEFSAETPEDTLFDKISIGSSDINAKKLYDINKDEIELVKHILKSISRCVIDHRVKIDLYGFKELKSLSDNQLNRLVCKVVDNVAKHRPDLLPDMLTPHLLVVYLRKYPEKVNDFDIKYNPISITKEIIDRAPEIINHIDYDKATELMSGPEWIRVLNKTTRYREKDLYLPHGMVDWIHKNSFTNALKGKSGTKRIPKLSPYIKERPE